MEARRDSGGHASSGRRRKSGGEEPMGAASGAKSGSRRVRPRGSDSDSGDSVEGASGGGSSSGGACASGGSNHSAGGAARRVLTDVEVRNFATYVVGRVQLAPQNTADRPVSQWDSPVATRLLLSEFLGTENVAGTSMTRVNTQITLQLQSAFPASAELLGGRRQWATGDRKNYDVWSGVALKD